MTPISELYRQDLKRFEFGGAYLQKKDELRQSYLSLIDNLIEREEGEKQELPKTECINAENHLFGSCFQCEKTKGFNSAKQETIDYWKEQREIISNV